MKKYNITSPAAVAIMSLGLVLSTPLFASAAGPAAINLLSAGNFSVLAKSGISTTGSTVIVGDIGVSPAAATFITGFSLNLSAGSAFATSSQVTGKVYAPGYADPTSTSMTTAVANMETAYTDGAGRTNPTATELGAGNIGGLTIAPGLYKWSSGVVIPTDVTLAGSANDVWIFQIAQTLTLSSGVHVVLSGGAQASNIFWIVGGQTTIGTTAVMNGIVLDQTAIVLNTGAQLNGRALAQTAVTLDSNSITAPSAAVVSASTPVSVPVPTPVPAASSSSSSSTNSSSYYGTGTSASGAVTAPSSNGNTTANTSAVVPSAAAFGQEVRMIATNLNAGNRNSNVTILQRFLIAQNKGSAARSLASVGATAYFGVLTRAALAEFQSAVRITPALGNFGPITRAYVSAHYY